MTNLTDGIANRLHRAFEAVGLAILTPLMGAKRAGQEHLQTHRVTIGSTIAVAGISAAVAALGSAAAGLPGIAVAAVATGIGFFGAFLGTFVGLVLRVVTTSALSKDSSTREGAQRKEAGRS